jgi:NAD+ diphosphatase
MLRKSIYKHYKPEVTAPPGDNGPAYWFVFCANKLLVTVDRDKATVPYFKSLSELNIIPVSIQYLGTLQGSPCYSAEASTETITADAMSFRDLRSLYGVLEEDIFLLAGKAIQIVSWDQTNQYCGRCGTNTVLFEGERAKKCPACGLINYPRISPAAITAVIKGNKILLTHNAAFRGNIHSLIAGFVEPGETIEECVHREIFEEVGLKVKNIKYFGSQPWPFPNSLMIGFTAEYESGEISVDGKEITEAGWYDISSLPDLPGKMSIARKIIDWFVNRQSNLQSS